MKIEKISSVFIFLSILTLALSFPLQVISSNPMIALIPYGLLVGALILEVPNKDYPSRIKWNTNKPMFFLISCYLFLVVFQTSWQTAFDFISFEDGVRTVILYAFPVLFFIYFRFFSNSRNFRAALYSMAIVGLLTGIYFAYDTYSMLVLGEVNDFSLRAFEYSEARADGGLLGNGRISVGYRSFGLLESHVVSSAWIVFGCLAALTITPCDKSLRRLSVIFLYGFLLLVGLNFTSLIGFAIVIYFMECWDGNKIFTLMVACILVSLLILSGTYLVNIELLQVIIFYMNGHIDLASGAEGYGESSYLGTLFHKLIYIPLDAADFPIGLLFGEGFSSFGHPKGGDFGVVEDFQRFGIPFFLIICVGLLKIVALSKKMINKACSTDCKNQDIRELSFAAGIVCYTLFNEIHYSVWNAKSVLPMLFISFALLDHILNPQTRSV